MTLELTCILLLRKNSPVYAPARRGEVLVSINLKEIINFVLLNFKMSASGHVTNHVHFDFATPTLLYKYLRGISHVARCGIKSIHTHLAERAKGMN